MGVDIGVVFKFVRPDRLGFLKSHSRGQINKVSKID